MAEYGAIGGSLLLTLPLTSAMSTTMAMPTTTVRLTLIVCRSDSVLTLVRQSKLSMKLEAEINTTMEGVNDLSNLKRKDKYVQ